MNRLKMKNHITLPFDTKKEFDKIQYSFMTKTCRKLGTEGPQSPYSSLLTLCALGRQLPLELSCGSYLHVISPLQASVLVDVSAWPSQVSSHLLSPKSAPSSASHTTASAFPVHLPEDAPPSSPLSRPGAQVSFALYPSCAVHHSSMHHSPKVYY